MTRYWLTNYQPGYRKTRCRVEKTDDDLSQPGWTSGISPTLQMNVQGSPWCWLFTRTSVTVMNCYLLRRQSITESIILSRRRPNWSKDWTELNCWNNSLVVFITTVGSFLAGKNRQQKNYVFLDWLSHRQRQITLSRLSKWKQRVD